MRKNRKKIIGLMILTLVIIGGTFAYLKISASNKSGGETEKNQPPSSDQVNDNDEINNNKQRIVENDSKLADQNDSPSVKNVVPLITYSGIYGNDVEVGAYVPGIFEENGKCVATFTNGSHQLSATVTAVTGSNSVDCPVMAKPVSEFPVKGKWDVVVSYSSPKASGKSDVKIIEVN